MKTNFYTMPPKRGRKPRTAPTTGSSPVPLELVSAVYDAAVPNVVLTFNQEINTDDMDLAAIEVQDLSIDEYLYRGFTTTGLTANSVTVELEPVEKRYGAGVTLTVGATNGIVAVADGSEWAGVTNLSLPFG